MVPMAVEWFWSCTERFLLSIGWKLLLPLLGLSLTAAAASLEPQSPKQIQEVQGAHFRELLAQSKNNPVILTFWASWCEPCRDEMPALQRLSERWRSSGLRVITIAVADKPERVSDFLTKVSANLPLVLDPDQIIAQNWGVYMLPATFVLDRQHRIIASSRGAIEWDTAPVDKQLQTLLQRR